MFGQSPANADPTVTATDERVHLGLSDVPVRQWVVSSAKPKAVVVAVHGALRSSGTFQPLAEKLAQQGYLVVSPDMRGHGDWYFSARNKIDKVANYDESTEDVVNLIKHMHALNPKLPIFCCGESAGGVVALDAARRFPTLNGLILSSIGTRPVVHDVQNIVRDIFAGMFNWDAPLDVKETMSKYASDDAQTAKEAAADPMLKPGMSPRELIRTARLLNQTASFATKLPNNIPVLLLQGKKDEIVMPSSAMHILKLIASKDKSVTEFPYGHILLSTPHLHSDVVNKVTDWLNTKTAEQQTASANIANSTSDKTN